MVLPIKLNKLKLKKIKIDPIALKNKLGHSLSFPLLLFTYITSRFLIRVFIFRYFPKKVRSKIYPPLASVYHRLVSFLDHHQPHSISEINLIELSLSNMKTKKTRTFITIGGMAMGIGIIVFLVSVGYGVQKLVITRVARLDEMRQADVSPKAGTQLKIDDKILSTFTDIKNVESVLPLIAVVGRLSYQKSISDVAVYGVTKDYLTSSAIKPTKGKIFDSNNLTTILPVEEEEGQVAGMTTDSDQMSGTDEIIREITFTINPESWVRVRQDPGINSIVLGYAKRTEGISFGHQVWGSAYISDQASGQCGQDENGDPIGQWIKSSFFLWQKEENDYIPLRHDNGTFVQEQGYIAQINVSLDQALVPADDSQILGLTDDPTDDGSSLGTGSLSLIDLSEVSTQSGEVEETSGVEKVDLPASDQRQAVVNLAVLKLLGIDPNDAVGKTFEASFVVVGDLLPTDKEKIESNPVEYTIVGVTPEEKTPLLYVPFIDLRGLGLSNYSQVKIVTKDQAFLADVRTKIEAMGFFTHSVSDTVTQINSLFGTIRTLLILLGMVALSVAALGMFNTLTVSLIERTREVGLMKAMGVRSSEVEQLFLTESILMGVFGGVFGVILGFLGGKLLGLILSMFAIIKGVGFIDVSYIPFSFIAFIAILSLVVGVFTGIYPARRAKKISALNALRYE